MIIYGSKMYFKKKVVKSFGQCEHCGVYGKQVSYQAQKFGHLYFIPLIPMGSRSQVLRECKRCQMGVQITTEELEPRVDELADQFKSWIMEASDGKKDLELQPGEPPVNIGVLIAGILDDLYCLKEVENVDSILEILDANDMQMESGMVHGRWQELSGDLEGAKQSYAKAHQAQPEDPIPLYQLGMTELKLGDSTAMEQTFERYQQLCPEDISPHIHLADYYDAKKEYGKMVNSYDILFTHQPALMQDKAMKKNYKRACKKSGAQGKFLAQV